MEEYKDRFLNAYASNSDWKEYYEDFVNDGIEVKSHNNRHFSTIKSYNGMNIRISFPNLYYYIEKEPMKCA